MKKTLTSASVLIIALTGACATSTTGDGLSDSSTPAASAKMGSKVRDGKFEFTVKSFKCGKAKAGKGFMAEKAQGQFCVAKMKVENIGGESQFLDASDQYLFDKRGRKFTAESLVGNSPFLEEINPGNTVTGKFYWDVPNKKFKADHLELHDSMFSDGIAVSIK